MTCWVMLFHVCLVDPSTAYLRADVSTKVAGEWAYRYRPEGGADFKTAPVLVGRLELGLQIALPHGWQMSYGIEHRSNIYTADRGEERVFVGLEWRPFRGSR